PFRTAKGGDLAQRFGVRAKLLLSPFSGSERRRSWLSVSTPAGTSAPSLSHSERRRPWSSVSTLAGASAPSLSHSEGEGWGGVLLFAQLGATGALTTVSAVRASRRTHRTAPGPQHRSV